MCWLIFVFCFCFHVSWQCFEEPRIHLNTTILTILILLNWMIISYYLIRWLVDYFILLYRCYVFSIVFVIHLLFSFLIYHFYFHLSNSSWSCVIFAFLSCICVIVFIIIFIIIFPQDLLSQKCRVKTNGSIYFFPLDLYMKTRFNLFFFFYYLWRNV